MSAEAQAKSAKPRGWIDTYRATIEINGLELTALKKLSLVSHALASKIGGRAGDEQKTLATVLDDVIRRIELAPPTSNGGDHG